MKRDRFLLVLIPFTAVLIGYGVWAKTACPPLRGADKSRLVDYVRKKYNLPGSAKLDIAKTSQVSATCYRRLEFQSQDPGKKFHVALFASPDLRFLAHDLMDSRSEPVADQPQPQRELAGAADGNFPVLGPPNAPVTLVVFSDFECPYCARFAAMMKEVLPAANRQVRLVFRHFPLPMHPWARSAAEAAQCGFEQKNDFFWNFHDFFFDHQRELTPDNLRRKVLEQARGMAGLDRGKFEACIARQSSKPVIDREVAFGNAHGIRGTPTVFANGRQAQVADADALRALIRQLAQNPQAPVPSAGSQPAGKAAPPPREIADLANGDLPALGPVNAPVTLAVFSDFECPYCAGFARMMREEILPGEPSRVRMVFHYLPLGMHPWARDAAEAAACAYRQKNDFFWTFHDFFFDHQKELTAANYRQKLSEIARGIHDLDTSKFEACLAAHQSRAVVERDEALAGRNGIESTPTVFLNGRQTEVIAPEQLQTLIRELAQAVSATPRQSAAGAL